jgi:hypothetical protein
MKHLATILFGGMFITLGTLYAISGRGGMTAYGYAEGSTARIGGALMIAFGVAIIYVDQKARLKKKKDQKNKIEPES